jgi:hypothetical protein
MAMIGIHAAKPLIPLQQGKVPVSILATVAAFFNVCDFSSLKAAIISSQTFH